MAIAATAATATAAVALAANGERRLRLLIVEDTPSDAALVVLQLRKAQYALTHRRVWTLTAMKAEIASGEWDFLITDYTLAGFNALDVLATMRQLASTIPVIVVSGTIGEELAVMAMVAGARDYVMKDNLPRLVPAIERELEEAESSRLRREAEAKLAETRRRQEMVLGNAPITLFGVDRNGRLTYTEGGSLAPAETGGVDVVGQKIADLYGDAPGVIEHLVRALAGESGTLEATIGEHVFQVHYAPNLAADGSPNGFSGVGVDITEKARVERELRFGEERLSAILENSVEGILVIAADGLVEYANRSMATMLGDDRNELLGASAIELAKRRFHNLGSDPFDLTKYALLGAGLRVQGEEVRLLRRDATEVPVTFSAAPIWMSDGSYRGTVVTVTDISQLRQQADELRRSVDTLRQADAERRQLVRHLVQAGEEERQRIAEDLHDDTIQAITVVGLRLGLLRRRFPDLDGDEQYRNLEQAVTDAVARCRSMLFDLHPRALDTEGLGAALEGYLQNYSTAGGPTCELEDDLITEPDSAGRVILFRITQEALVNVRKHAHASHAHIKLWNQDHGFAISVKDDGIGFDPGTNGSGHGHLGLTTMHERAAQAQGWLRVESVPGKGTNVESWIPESSDVDAA